jgi:hypothetical protein
MEPASGPLIGTAGQKVFLFFCYAEIPSHFLSWCGNCEGDPPLSPKGGGSPRGQAPSTPKSGWIFLHAAEIHSHAPRGETRRGGESPWPHRYPILVPSSVF